MCRWVVSELARPRHQKNPSFSSSILFLFFFFSFLLLLFFFFFFSSSFGRFVERNSDACACVLVVFYYSTHDTICSFLHTHIRIYVVVHVYMNFSYDHTTYMQILTELVSTFSSLNFCFFIDRRPTTDDSSVIMR